MRTALRRMGNSVGMILPKPLLRAAGLTSGAALDVAVEDGRLIVTPVTTTRTGWSEAAASIAEAAPSAEETDWRAFGVMEDAEWQW